MVRKLLRIIPVALRCAVRKRLDLVMRQYKAPRMVWGYQNPSGAWRPRTRISDTAFMYYPDRIQIDDNVFVWHYTILDGSGGLEIGEGSQIGAWVGIFTHSSHIAIRIYGNHYQEVAEKEKKGYLIKCVKIGKYVFLGAGSMILPGVAIGNGALVSAGSIVRKNVNDFEIVSGNPAKVIGDTRKLDKQYLEDQQIMEWYYEWQKT